MRREEEFLARDWPLHTAEWDVFQSSGEWQNHNPDGWVSTPHGQEDDVKRGGTTITPGSLGVVRRWTVPPDPGGRTTGSHTQSWCRSTLSVHDTPAPGT